MVVALLARVLAPALALLLPALLLLALFPPPGAAAPSPGPALTITVQGTITSDEATGLVVGEGGVRLSDGTTEAEGARIVLDRARGRAQLTGSPARVRSPEGTLSARQVEAYFTAARLTRIVARGAAALGLRRGTVRAETITLVPGGEALTASGGVRVTSPPDLVATGSALTYARGSGRLVLEGPVRLATAQGVVTGARLEGREGVEEATLSGGVVAQFSGITARGQVLHLRARDRVAVLAGDVYVRQGTRELWSPRVTIHYGERRVVADGPTRLRLGGEAPEP